MTYASQPSSGCQHLCQKSRYHYITVPSFKNTGIECLGDLGRYHMAIEDNDIYDQGIEATLQSSGTERQAMVQNRDAFTTI